MRPFRLLPLIFLLALGLIGKVSLLGDRILSSATVHLGVPPAEANESGDNKHDSAQGGEKAAADSHAADGKGAKAAAKAACPPPPPPPEPTGPTFNETELAVLQQLAQRRDELQQREDELQGREAILSASEARIDEKVASLKQLQASLEGLIRQHDAEQENKLKSLVKIYETMKPTDAARIFEQLDLDTLLPVVDQMKERKLAAILASLNPAKARDVTVELKKLRELTPQPPA